MADIPCPVCMATGHDPLDIDWGVTYVAQCPCCEGSKTVTQMTVNAYISKHRLKVVELQNEVEDLKTKLRRKVANKAGVSA